VRVIDCDCGKTLGAANDEDLFNLVQVHLEEDHPGADLDDNEVRELIAEQAYEASDA
jgi:hypothetical protein